MNKGLNLMADYVFLSKYSQRKTNGELENWNESVDRIYDMHDLKIKSLGLDSETVKDYIKRAKELEYKKVILSSQRGRQFAQPSFNSGILKHETKMYNCTATFIDRVDVFSEVMYLLLCGCGVGYSLHKEYINRLPNVDVVFSRDIIDYVIEDSIEGWGESIKVLMYGIFEGFTVNFDYSKIRPNGALIDGKFKAPGHEPLKKAHEKIMEVAWGAQGRKFKSVELHDILCYIADGVVSGGVRRSAMIALFDKGDDDMMTCKTGNWWMDNPQRAMANNSTLTSYEESMTYKEIKESTNIIRQFGEPGNVNVPDYDWVVNPCAEIVMRPIYNKKTGFTFCNLVEINAENVHSEQEFYEACEIASFVATIQALYTDFKFLSETSKRIAEFDRNIGVSITGIFANDLLKKDVLKKGAKTVAEVNGKFALQFRINKSRTCTTIKPSGNASSILGLSCSGIHPAHSPKYLRRIRIKTNSPEFKKLKDTPMVKMLRGDDAVISFPIEITNGKVVFKDSISAVEHMTYIAMVKHYWINKGSLNLKTVNHNVSATVEVSEGEWDEVAAVMFANSHLFTGISLLPKMGDQIYDNAPFTRISGSDTEKEFNDITEYLANNELDFIDIMSDRQLIYSGDTVAVGCVGNACEIK